MIDILFIHTYVYIQDYTSYIFKAGPMYKRYRDIYVELRVYFDGDMKWAVYQTQFTQTNTIVRLRAPD